MDINSIILSNLISSNVPTGNQSNNSGNNFNSTLNSLIDSYDNSNSNTIGLYSLLNNNSSSGLMNGNFDMAMYSLLNATARNMQNQMPSNSRYNTNSTCSKCCNHKEENNNISNVIESTIKEATSNNKTVNAVNTSAIKNNSNTNTSLSSKAVSMAKSFLGTPYVWGANGPKSFDCSGFTKYIYKQVYGKDIPRVSYDQAKFGTKIDKKDLKAGDLVFFDTMNKGRVSHVGIYIGDGKFIHAANPKKGVIESDLNSSYYTKTYRGARRP